MVSEARAETERALFGEEAMAATRNRVADEREAQADEREREQMEHDVRVQREQ